MEGVLLQFWHACGKLSGGEDRPRVLMQGGGEQKKRDTKDAVAIQVPYLRVVGLEEEAEGAHSTPIFT